MHVAIFECKYTNACTFLLLYRKVLHSFIYSRCYRDLLPIYKDIIEILLKDGADLKITDKVSSEVCYIFMKSD